MKTSDAIDQIATALASAGGEFTNPEKNREVKVRTKSGYDYSFRYATMDAITRMARPILAKHGLFASQPASIVDDKVIVTTKLTHSSGQWFESELCCRPESFGLQQIGSAISYLRRYSYCAMLCIDSDEDDDGNAASGNQIMHQTSQDAPAASQPNLVPSETPKPATATPEPPKAKPAAKKVSNVYSNAKKAIETATDNERLDALTQLLGVRWQEKALSDEQSTELQDLINKQRETLATAAASLFPPPEDVESPAEVPNATA